MYIKAAPGTGSAAYAVLIQPDGKTLLVGGLGDSLKSWFLMVRLTAGGGLDTTFGDGGVVETPIPVGIGSVADAVVLTADGRILAGGYARWDAGVSDLAIARYSPGGALDGTFGDGGLALVTFSPPESASLSSIAVLPDGHVLAAGSVGLDGSLGIVGSKDYLIVKFKPNGSLDTTFGTGGKVRVDIRSVDGVGAMVVQPDGKILIVGASSQANSTPPPTFGPTALSAFRLNPDGSLDPSFGSAGKVVLALAMESGASSVALDGTGRTIVGGGLSTPAGDAFAVFRLDSTGALDTAFGTGGVASTNFGGDWRETFSLYVQPDGRYVMAGVSATSASTVVRDALARFLPDGAPDLALAAGGRVLVPNPAGFRVRNHAAAFGGDRATVAGHWWPLPIGSPGWEGWMGASRYCL